VGPEPLLLAFHLAFVVEFAKGGFQVDEVVMCKVESDRTQG